MHNHQVQRFNSRYWNPGSEAVDAFTYDWSGKINWWCPPPFLIPCLAQATNTAGTLVVPQWCSAPYWPLLFPDKVHPAEFIKDVVVIPAWESQEPQVHPYSGECPTQNCGACGLIFVAQAESEHIRVARGWIIRVLSSVSLFSHWLRNCVLTIFCWLVGQCV